MNDDELITHLRATGRSTLRPERAHAIRQALLAEFDRARMSPPHRQAAGFIRSLAPRPVAAGAVASIVLALGFGTAAIANTARPGDALFAVDRAAERIRLALTVGDEARAVYEARTAEERLSEKIELESEDDDHADDASRIAGQTLDRAISTVDKVKIKLQGRNAPGAEALAKVEDRLRGLRDDHIGRIKVEVETEKGTTKIKVESGHSSWEWRSASVEREGLLAEIAARTGLLIDDLRAALTFTSDGEDGGDEDDSDADTKANDVPVTPSKSNVNDSNRNKKTVTPSNSNRDDDPSDDPRNANTNTSGDDETGNENTNQNTNTGGDDDDDRAEIQVRVDLEDDNTEIHTTVNGEDQEWEVEAKDRATILESIVSRTGLTVAQITRIWDFEQH